MPRTNRLFESLGPATRERLRPHLDIVSLEKGRILCELGDTPRFAYFPLDGMLSFVGLTEDGHALQLATAGSDGLVGTPLLHDGMASPYQVLVQIAGTTQRVRGDAFVRECRRCEDLLTTVLAYAGRVSHEVVRSAMCHAFHALPQRVCRSLLVTRDYAHANTIELTQEVLAHMLGVSRSKVSRALATLEARRWIHQGHGRIHIVDLKGLQAGSCGCYRAAARDIPIQQPLHGVR